MRADHLMGYGADGRAYLVTASPDAEFVVSAYLEHGSSEAWHFAYTSEQQEQIATVISKDPSLRRAIVVAWYDAVDPYREGYHPAVELDLIITGAAGWGRFATGEREDGHPVMLLTVDENSASPTAVRLGRELYADRPFLPAERVRAAGAQYVRTGHRPDSVRWQRRTGVVPRGPFGRQLVAEEDLPPRLDWSYPQKARPWASDPPPVPSI